MKDKDCIRLRSVALVRIDVSEKLNASFITVTRIGEPVTTLDLVFLRSVRRLLVTASVVPSTPIRHPDDGGAKFLRNVRYYNSHTAEHTR
jgi:hypothetical protein